MNKNLNKEVLVLYSGGRDSSATVVELAKSGYKLRLFTFQMGLPELKGFLGDSAPDIRHKELLSVFPKNIERERIIIGDTYIIRKIAIEKTNKEHVVYPIALALAVHTNAIKYCLENDIKIMASGYSGHQSIKDKYIEQRKDFEKMTRKFVREYGISYLSPVLNKSEDEIKDILERFDISSNSLENKSIFGGVYFDKKYSLNYWKSALPICRDFIKKATFSKK